MRSESFAGSSGSKERGLLMKLRNAVVLSMVVSLMVSIIAEYCVPANIWAHHKLLFFDFPAFHGLSIMALLLLLILSSGISSRSSLRLADNILLWICVAELFANVLEVVINSFCPRFEWPWMFLWNAFREGPGGFYVLFLESVSGVYLGAVNYLDLTSVMFLSYMVYACSKVLFLVYISVYLLNRYPRTQSISLILLIFLVFQPGASSIVVYSLLMNKTPGTVYYLLSFGAAVSVLMLLHIWGGLLARQAVRLGIVRNENERSE